MTSRSRFGGSDGDPLDDGQGPRRLPGTAAWTPEGPSYGFGSQVGHLPQPDWFRSYAVSVQALRFDTEPLPAGACAPW